MLTTHQLMKNKEDVARPSRREWLIKTACLTGGFLAFGLPFSPHRIHSVLAAPPKQPSIRYVLELQGNLAGPLIDVQSGFISGQVTTQTMSPITFKKHLSGILYEDIVIQCGNDMAPSLYQWIQQTLNGQIPPQQGAILTINMQNQVIDRKEFHDARLTEIQFPALDSSSQSRGLLKLRIKPGQTHFQPGTGLQISLPSSKQFPSWLISHFRLNIHNLEQACSTVTNIEALVWKQQISHGQIGARYSQPNAPGLIETPNLVISLPLAQAEPFTQWFREFVIQGNASDNQERPGLLEILGPDLQTPIMTLSFGHLGIIRMSAPNVQTSGHPLVQVEMYCEVLQLTQFPGGVSGGAQPPPQTPPAQPKSRIQPPTNNVTPRLPLKR